MKLTAFSSFISLMVGIASIAVSVTITASEQPLLRDSNFKDAKDAIRSIQVDASVSEPGPNDHTPESRELGFFTQGDSDLPAPNIINENSAFYDDCTDDESFRYEYINKKGKPKLKGGCTDFVSRKKKKRCRKRIDGSKVRDYCPLTCGSCEKKKKKKHCSVERFIGVWLYLSCKAGASFELTISCDDHGLLCSAKDRKIANITDDENNNGGDVELIYRHDDDDAAPCTKKGSFDPSNQIVEVRNKFGEYDCELLFVPLDGGTCEDAEDEESFGVKATLKSSKDYDSSPLIMAMFSSDGGEMYYNKTETFLVSDIDNNGESKNVNVRRRELFINCIW